MRWQDEVTDDQWKEWLKLAEIYASKKRILTSLGYEDFSGQAIQKLLVQANRPANVEAWIRLVITNQYRDWLDRSKRRGGPELHVENDSDWEMDILEHAVGSPSVRIFQREDVNRILEVLNEDEKTMLLSSVIGYTNHEIAEDMGLGSGRIAATRLGQIRKKVRGRLSQLGNTPS